MNQNIYNVGTYVRLSKDDERAGESVSIENQKLILTKYVQDMGWNQKDIYVDDGVSGTTFDRPGFQRMLEDAKEGKINLILVKDLSRFGRNYIQIGQFTDYIFPAIGCRFVALNDGVDTINNDNDIMPFKNLFNEFHSKDISKKIKAVKQARADRGMYLGCYAPYGYAKDPDNKHKFIVDEVAAENVKTLFNLRCQGIGFRKIAGTMNELGIMSPRDYYYQQLGKQNPAVTNHVWNDVTVKKMLRNEVYIGHMVQNKRGTLSYKNHKQVSKPKEEWIKVVNTHEPIIDMETWNAVVDMDKRNINTRSTGDGETSLFCGLVKCMDCGFMMRVSQENHKRKNGTKVKYISYMCGSYARSGKAACSSHIIYENRLLEIIQDDIRKYAEMITVDEESLVNQIISQKEKDCHLQISNDISLLKATSQRLAELDKLIQSLYEDKVMGKISDSVFANLCPKYELELKEKQELKSKLEQKLESSKQDKRDISRWIDSIKKCVNVELLDREMLLELIDYVEIGERQIIGNQKYRDITIHYKFVGNLC